ncbi:MAG: tsaB [Gammaproteobacteria bacterium]|nr:tsaB [Gammaproteobacteria bacterium]
MKPIILAFDTSTESCTVALQTKSQVYSLHEVQPRRHNELLLNMIQTLMNQANIDFKQLDTIAFGAGPGSFVGVRIAVAVAQGLAFASQKPVIALSSLQVMAQTAYREEGTEQAQLVIDARMQQAYVGHYQVKNGIMLPVKPDSIEPIDKVNMATDFQTVQVLPNAIDMLPLAQFYFELGELLKPEQALPVYLDEAKQWKKLAD